MATTTGHNKIAQHILREKYTERELKNARYNNQFALKENNPEIKDEAFTFFLEYVETNGFSYILEDALGKEFSLGITVSLNLVHSPLRLDGGFRIETNGMTDIAIARGFKIAHGPSDHSLAA